MNHKEKAFFRGRAKPHQKRAYEAWRFAGRPCDGTTKNRRIAKPRDAERRLRRSGAEPKSRGRKKTPAFAGAFLYFSRWSLADITEHIPRDVNFVRTRGGIHKNMASALLARCLIAHAPTLDLLEGLHFVSVVFRGFTRLLAEELVMRHPAQKHLFSVVLQRFQAEVLAKGVFD